MPWIICPAQVRTTYTCSLPGETPPAPLHTPFPGHHCGKERKDPPGLHSLARVGPGGETCLSMLEDVSPISSSSPVTRVCAQVSSTLCAYLRHRHSSLPCACRTTHSSCQRSRNREFPNFSSAPPPPRTESPSARKEQGFKTHSPHSTIGGVSVPRGPADRHSAL